MASKAFMIGVKGVGVLGQELTEGHRRGETWQGFNGSPCSGDQRGVFPLG